MPWALGLTLAIAAGVAVWLAMPATNPEQRGPTRLSIALPPDVSLYAIGRGSSVAVSPDGRRIVYAGIAGDRTQLYFRLLEGFASTPMAGTEGGANPFFSPDGRWIGFIANGRLKKVPVESGVVLPVGDARGVQSATWTADDAIIFSTGTARDAGLWRVGTSGGQPQRLTTTRKGESTHAWPQMLGDGKHLLYTSWNNTGFEGGRVVVQSLQGGEPTVLVQGASYGRVVLPGAGRAYLIFVRPEGLLAAPFDLDRMQLSGRQMPAVESVLTNLSGGAHYSVSPSGVLAYIPGTLDEIDKTLLWVNRAGMAEEIGTITGMSFQYRVSPDGRRVVRPNAQGPARDIWVDDVQRLGTPTRITSGGLHNLPIWTPDGQRLIFSGGAPVANLFWRAADGTGEVERLTQSPNRQFAGSASPDGSTLIYVEGSAASASDIWLMSLRGSRAPRLLVGTPFVEMSPRIAPDGRWIAYQSTMSGQFEVYVTSIQGSGRQIAVSKAADSSRCGRRMVGSCTTATLSPRRAVT